MIKKSEQYKFIFMEKHKMEKVYTFGDLENIQSFIVSLKRKANKLGIQLQLDDSKHIELSDNIKVGGYFMERVRHTPGILATATGLSIKKWLPTLVHESCHMDQWDEGTELWKECEKLPEEIIDNWLEGKKYPKKLIENAINITRDLELDCEKRTVDKIKKFNLPIDIPECIQKANAYIFFHNWMKKTRKWCDKEHDPFEDPKIYKKFSKDWYNSYEETPIEIEKLFKKYKV